MDFPQEVDRPGIIGPNDVFFGICFIRVQEEKGERCLEIEEMII